MIEILGHADRQNEVRKAEAAGRVSDIPLYFVVRLPITPIIADISACLCRWPSQYLALETQYDQDERHHVDVTSRPKPDP